MKTLSIIALLFLLLMHERFVNRTRARRYTSMRDCGAAFRRLRKEMVWWSVVWFLAGSFAVLIWLPRFF